MLTVLATGPQATIQDLGRRGLAALGVPRTGAADRASLRLANRLVGNAEDAAAIEVTFGGLVVRAVAPAVVALTGASGPVHMDGRAVAHGEPLQVPAGTVLELGPPVVGLRTYVGVAGGIDVAPVLGSRSTDTLSGIGPEPLREGSHLPVGNRAGLPAHEAAVSSLPHGEVQLRVVVGPRDDWFTTESIERLLTSPWRIDDRADRVGLQLRGPALERGRLGELPSEGCTRGAIQVTPDGVPIVFGPDHPVTGGYPVPAVVVDGDCDRLGQVRPGDVVRLQRR